MLAVQDGLFWGIPSVVFIAIFLKKNLNLMQEMFDSVAHFLQVLFFYGKVVILPGGRF